MEKLKTYALLLKDKTVLIIFNVNLKNNSRKVNKITSVNLYSIINITESVLAFLFDSTRN